jgi:hypothetical protein
MAENPPAGNPPVRDSHSDGIAEGLPGVPAPGLGGTRGPAESPTGTPRWVKVFATVGVVLVLLVVVLLLAGHGPKRHLGNGPGGHAADSLLTAGAAFGDEPRS